MRYLLQDRVSGGRVRERSGWLRCPTSKITCYHEMVYYEARLKDHSFSKQQIKNVQMLYQEQLNCEIELRMLDNPQK